MLPSPSPAFTSILSQRVGTKKCPLLLSLLPLQLGNPKNPASQRSHLSPVKFCLHRQEPTALSQISSSVPAGSQLQTERGAENPASCSVLWEGGRERGEAEEQSWVPQASRLPWQKFETHNETLSAHTRVSSSNHNYSYNGGLVCLQL